MKKGKKIFLILFSLALFASFACIASAQISATVCCEQTKSGLYCQDVPSEQCAPNVRQVPTACRATSYCNPGVCFDSNEGTCLENTPQKVCNINKGVWSEKPVSQCNLGCCILGDQAAFVTLTRCKRLSSFLGLETNYNKELKSETGCIASVLGQERGACVYESELRKSCMMTTRAECAGGISGVKGEFYKGKLCSAEELGTICGPTTKTTCVPGREEVYFIDSCGNPANVYDASKTNDKEYWSNMKEKGDACNPDASNANNPSCGNCNYLMGSFCRSSETTKTRATYGDYICADLNCDRTSNGKSYKHGESWCVYDDEGETGKGNNAVGSRFYKHICLNGEEILEACADYRQHECIEDAIELSGAKFSQAACRVNRWQDCVAQNSKTDCENIDKRDCLWVSPYATRVNYIACVPKNSPGLKFWEGEEAAAICAQASVTCSYKCEKDLLGKVECDGDCVDKKGNVKIEWLNRMESICFAMGDCSSDSTQKSGNVNKINWLGQKGVY